jgi:hypothetical protein
MILNACVLSSHFSHCKKISRLCCVKMSQRGIKRFRKEFSARYRRTSPVSRSSNKCELQMFLACYSILSITLIAAVLRDIARHSVSRELLSFAHSHTRRRVRESVRSVSMIHHYGQGFRQAYFLSRSSRSPSSTRAIRDHMLIAC